MRPPIWTGVTAVMLAASMAVAAQTETARRLAAVEVADAAPVVYGEVVIDQWAPFGGTDAVSWSPLPRTPQIASTNGARSAGGSNEKK